MKFKKKYHIHMLYLLCILLVPYEFYERTLEGNGLLYNIKIFWTGEIWPQQKMKRQAPVKSEERKHQNPISLLFSLLSLLSYENTPMVINIKVEMIFNIFLSFIMIF